MIDRTIVVTALAEHGNGAFTYPLNEPEAEVRPWSYPDLESFESVRDGKRVRVVHEGI